MTAIGAVLMYHRIAELAPDGHRLCTPPARFHDQLREVAARYEVVPLVDFVDTMSSRPRIAITLDDGTIDALVAADILDELGVPATFFVTTTRLDDPHEHWWDSFERLARPEAERPRFLYADKIARDAELRALGLPAPRATHRCLLASEIVALGQRHTIGAHGCDHLHLPSLTEEGQRHELGQSKHALEQLLGHEVPTLSYPYGAHDERAVDVARAFGYRCAVTVESRAVDAGDAPLRLPRIDAQGLSADALVELLADVLGHARKEI